MRDRTAELVYDKAPGSVTMNRIIRENYPVSALPKDLQKDFVGQDEVTVIVQSKPLVHQDHDSEAPSVAGYFSQFRHLARNNFAGMEEIVAHVHSLRDEWEERDRLLRPGS